MSNEIEDRVVSLSFDNSNFDSNVDSSIKSLDKLETKLQLAEGTEGFAKVQKAANNANFDHIASALDSLSGKFSAMGIMAATTIANITYKMESMAARVFNRLSIAPITEGWSQYGEEMNYTQVIMNNTGRSMKDVEDKLANLNEYAKQTIYSFGQMTYAVGKFAAAGVDLDMSVTAIKGLSNAAAMVGANNQQLYMSFYNLSQSMQMGYLKLIDWKSIANSSIGTRQMRQEFVKTAIEMGKFTESSEMARLAYSDFEGSLSKKWLTTDVITKTLEKYTDETNELGKAATAAATELKSFGQMFEVLTDETKTAWTKIWKTVIGDLDQAKTLWTNVGNRILFLIERINEARQKIMDDWAELGGQKKLMEGIIQLLQSIRTILGPVYKVADRILHITGEGLYKITEGFYKVAKSLELTETQAAGLEKVLYALLTPIDLFVKTIKVSLIFAGKLISIVFSVLKGVLSLVENIKNSPELLKVLFGENYEEKFKAVSKLLYNVKKIIGTLFGIILKAITKILPELLPLLGAVAEAVTAVISVIAEVLDMIAGSDFEWLHSIIDSIVVILRVMVSILKKIPEFLTKLFRGELGKAAQNLVRILGKLAEIIAKIVNVVATIIHNMWPVLEPLLESLGNALLAVCDAVLTLLSSIDPNMLNIFITALSAIAKIATVILNVFAKLTGFVSGLFNKASEFISGKLSIIEKAGQNTTSAWAEGMTSASSKIDEASDTLVNRINDKLDQNIPNIENSASIIGESIDNGITAGMSKGFGSITKSNSVISDKINKSLTGSLDKAANQVTNSAEYIFEKSGKHIQKAGSKAVGTSIGDAFVDSMSSAISTVADDTNQIGNRIGSVFSNVGHTISDILHKTDNDISDGVVSVQNNMSTFAYESLIASQNLSEGTSNNIVVFEKNVDSFSDKMNAMSQSMHTAFDGMGTTIGTEFLRISYGISLIVQSFGDLFSIINENVRTIVLLAGIVAVFYLINKALNNSARISRGFKNIGVGIKRLGAALDTFAEKGFRFSFKNNNKVESFGSQFMKVLFGLSAFLFGLSVFLKSIGKYKDIIMDPSATKFILGIGIYVSSLITAILIVQLIVANMMKNVTARTSSSITAVSRLIRNVFNTLTVFLIVLSFTMWWVNKVGNPTNTNEFMNKLVIVVGIMSAAIIAVTAIMSNLIKDISEKTLSNQHVKLITALGKAVAKIAIGISTISWAFKFITQKENMISWQTVVALGTIMAAMVAIVFIICGFLSSTESDVNEVNSKTKNLKQLGKTIFLVGLTIAGVIASIQLLDRIHIGRNTLASLFISLGFLVTSLYIIVGLLSEVDKERIKKSAAIVGVMSLLLINLSGLMYAFRYFKNTDADYGTIIKFSIVFSQAIGSLILIVKLLSNVDSDRVGKAAAITGMLSLIVASISGLLYSIRFLSAKSWRTVAQFGAILGGIVGILTIIVTGLSRVEGNRIGRSLVITGMLSLIVVGIVSILKSLKEIDRLNITWTTMSQLGSIIGVAMALVGFCELVSRKQDVIMKGYLGMGALLLTIPLIKTAITALKDISGLDIKWESLGQFGSVLGAMAALSGIAAAVGQASYYALIGAAVIAAIGGSIYLCSMALQKAGETNWEKVANGITLLKDALVGTGQTGKTFGFAGMLVVLSIAIALIAPGLDLVALAALMFAGALNLATGASEKFAKSIERIRDALKDIVPLMNDLTSGVANMAVSVSSVMEDLKNSCPNINEVSLAFKGLGIGLMFLGAGANVFSIAMVAGGVAANFLATAFVIMSAGIRILADASFAVDKLLTTLHEHLKDITDLLKAMKKNSFGGLAWGGGLALILWGLSKFGEGIKAFGQGLVWASVGIIALVFTFKLLSKTCGDVLTSIKDGFVSFGNTLKNFFRTMLSEEGMIRVIQFSKVLLGLGVGIAAVAIGLGLLGWGLKKTIFGLVLFGATLWGLFALLRNYKDIWGDGQLSDIAESFAGFAAGMMGAGLMLGLGSIPMGLGALGLMALFGVIKHYWDLLDEIASTNVLKDAGAGIAAFAGEMFGAGTLFSLASVGLGIGGVSLITLGTALSTAAEGYENISLALKNLKKTLEELIKLDVNAIEDLFTKLAISLFKLAVVFHYMESSTQVILVLTMLIMALYLLLKELFLIITKGVTTVLTIVEDAINRFVIIITSALSRVSTLLTEFINTLSGSGLNKLTVFGKEIFSLERADQGQNISGGPYQAQLKSRGSNMAKAMNEGFVEEANNGFIQNVKSVGENGGEAVVEGFNKGLKNTSSSIKSAVSEMQNTTTTDILPNKSATNTTKAAGLYVDNMTGLTEQAVKTDIPKLTWVRLSDLTNNQIEIIKERVENAEASIQAAISTGSDKVGFAFDDFSMFSDSDLDSLRHNQAFDEAYTSYLNSISDAVVYGTNTNANIINSGAADISNAVANGANTVATATTNAQSTIDNAADDFDLADEISGYFGIEYVNGELKIIEDSFLGTLDEVTDGAVTAILEEAQNFSEVWEKVKDIFSGEGLSDLVSGLLPDFMTDPEKIWDGIKEITSNTLDLGGAFDKFADSLGDVTSAGTETKGTMETLQDTIRNQLHIFEKFDDATNISTTELLENMQSQVNGIRNWSKGIQVLGVRGMSKELIKYLADMGPQGYKYVEAFLEMTEDEFQKANSLYAESLQLPDEASGYIRDGFEWAGVEIVESVKKAAGKTDEAFKREFKTVEETAKIAGENTAYAYVGMLDKVVDDVEYQNLLAQFSDETMRQLLLNSTEWLKEGDERLASYLSDRKWLAKKRSSKDTMESSINDRARYLVEGMEKSINGAQLKAMLKNCGYDFSYWLVSGTDDYLGSTPSSNIMEDKAMNLANGMVKGLETASIVVRSAGSDLGENATDAITTSIEKVMDVFTADLDLTPTITPVVDMTNIERGAGRIHELLSSNNAISDAISGIKVKAVNTQSVVTSEATRSSDNNAALVDAITSSNQPIYVNITADANTARLFDFIVEENLRATRAKGSSPLVIGYAR